MQLFGGTVRWRANKQATVTASTTEAKLLALSQEAREGEFVSRLPYELTVGWDQKHIQTYRDNKQMI